MLAHWFQLLFQQEAVPPDPVPETPAMGGWYPVEFLQKKEVSPVENDDALLLLIIG